jgi:hypothetical protein
MASWHALGESNATWLVEEEHTTRATSCATLPSFVCTWLIYFLGRITAVMGASGAGKVGGQVPCNDTASTALWIKHAVHQPVYTLNFCSLQTTMLNVLAGHVRGSATVTGKIKVGRSPHHIIQPRDPAWSCAG